MGTPSGFTLLTPIHNNSAISLVLILPRQVCRKQSLVGKALRGWMMYRHGWTTCIWWGDLSYRGRIWWGGEVQWVWLRGARCDEGVRDILWGGCDVYDWGITVRAVDACHMVRSDLMMTCDMVRRGFDNVKPLLTITSSQASTYQTDACDMVYVRKCVTCDRV